jgi:Ca2+/H+ antiporter, TMEM165/GDT1 family
MMNLPKNEDRNMKPNRILRVLKFVVIAVVAFSVFGFLIMSLWNWLMPGIFGLHLIGFWQAVGILVLSKILFGGFRPRFGPGMHWRRRMMARWEQMTPEEREKFREGLRSRCGQVGPPASEQKV